MNNLSHIIKPVEKEMEAFIELYKESLQGHSADFQSIINYMSETNGKKIRPLLLLLTAKICGDINQNSLNYALVLELLHNATLIHDDIVDDTKERRGRSSINARYDNKTAVLIGDYILSIAIVKAVATQNMKILNIISDLAMNLVEGELRQLSNSAGAINEAHYFDIIRKKTAILFSSCTEMGALSTGVNEKIIENFRLFGEYLGICFQIKDDLFDYFEQGEIGKPTGNDLREGKITLPLIYALKHASDKNECDAILQIIKNADFTAENILLLINFAKNNGGTNYAQQKMTEYKQKALGLIEGFADSEAKKSLLNLVDYIIERNK